MKTIKNIFFENSPYQSHIIHDPWCEILHTKVWTYAKGDPTAFPGNSDLLVVSLQSISALKRNDLHFREESRLGSPLSQEINDFTTYLTRDSQELSLEPKRPVFESGYWAAVILCESFNLSKPHFLQLQNVNNNGTFHTGLLGRLKMVTWISVYHSTTTKNNHDP